MKVYIVLDVYTGDDDDVTVKAFSTKEKAIDYVAKKKEQYLKECSHFQLEEDEERWFTMQYDDWRCMIEVYMVDAEVDEEF